MSVPALTPNTTLPRKRFQFSLRTFVSAVLGAALLMYAAYKVWQYKYDTFPDDLERMESADAATDLQQALQRDDYRFVGMHGLGLRVPGPGTNEYYAKYEKPFGVKVIEGTSDCIVGIRHGQLQYKASRYALKYNARLIKAIEERPSPDGTLPPELERMETADPLADVAAAIRSQNYS